VTGTVNERRAGLHAGDGSGPDDRRRQLPIVVTLGSNPNYEVTKHDGTLTIGKASASVTANDKSKTYGQANPAFDAVVTGAVNKDVLAYTWRRQRTDDRRRQLPIVVTWAATRTTTSRSTMAR
jgi:hypothetical protein